VVRGALGCFCVAWAWGCQFQATASSHIGASRHAQAVVSCLASRSHWQPKWQHQWQPALCSCCRSESSSRKARPLTTVPTCGRQPTITALNMRSRHGARKRAEPLPAFANSRYLRFHHHCRRSAWHLAAWVAPGARRQHTTHAAHRYRHRWLCQAHRSAD